MSGVLGLEKVSKEVLGRSVLPYIPVDDELELDGATIRLPDRIVVAHSPSIGVPLEALGFFAFHYAATNVVALSGRMVRALGKPLICVEVVYGGSRLLAFVVLEAMKLDCGRRAAVSVRGGQDVYDGLEGMGLSVALLPSEVGGEGCPVSVFLQRGGGLFDAYAHPRAFGIEPATTIVAETPSELTDIL
jgi:predicted fused transcriptional regulator/phosphomethylpyrimidine kinase